MKCNIATIQWKIGKKSKIIYCPEKYCIIVHLEHSFFFSSLALLASSSQLGHAVAFPPFCFVLADNMNGVLCRVVSVRNGCIPFQKCTHWKTLIVKMQISKKWYKKIVNQDIPFLVIVSAQTPTTFGYSSKKNRTSHC